MSHDSHNLIVTGTSEEEMAAAANACIEMGGGLISLPVIPHLKLTTNGLINVDNQKLL